MNEQETFVATAYRTDRQLIAEARRLVETVREGLNTSAHTGEPLVIRYTVIVDEQSRCSRERAERDAVWLRQIFEPLCDCIGCPRDWLTVSVRYRS